MVPLLARLLKAARRSWLAPVAVIVFVFVTSWIMMAILEPNTGVADPKDFWWWFVVTSATVGYGDIYPETIPGRLVGVYVIVGGIITLTTIFTKVGEALENARGRRMQGLGHFRDTGHVVVMGYTAGRSETLLRSLLQDGESALLACSEDQAGENPMPAEPVSFVRGDLTDESVLARANVAAAKGVLIDPRDDNEAVTLTVAVEQAAPEVHTVVALRDLSRRRTIHRVDSTVQCVEWHATGLITEELVDPGITAIYQELMGPENKNTYSTVVPDAAAGATYGGLQRVLGEQHDATVLAVRQDGAFDVSAAWTRPVPAGAILFYIADRRLTPDELVQAARAS